MRKERDYHRMHHNRVIQEKNKLISDLKRLKGHYETYEPLIRTMKAKYDVAIREKVLNQLERDRAVAELTTTNKNDTLQSNFVFISNVHSKLNSVILFLKESFQKQTQESDNKRYNYLKKTDSKKEDDLLNNQRHPKVKIKYLFFIVIIKCFTFPGHWIPSWRWC